MVRFYHYNYLKRRENFLKTKGYNGKDLIFGIRQKDIKGAQIAIDTYPAATVKSEVVDIEIT